MPLSKAKANQQARAARMNVQKWGNSNSTEEATTAHAASTVTPATFEGIAVPCSPVAFNYAEIEAQQIPPTTFDAPEDLPSTAEASAAEGQAYCSPTIGAKLVAGRFRSRVAGCLPLPRASTSFSQKKRNRQLPKRLEDICDGLQGQRVILDLGLLLEFLKRETRCSSCLKGYLMPAVRDGHPVMDTRGLASSIMFQCTVCSASTCFTTSRKLEADNKTQEINLLHVLGEQNAGLAPAKVEKFLTTLGIQYDLHRTNHSLLQKRVGKEVVAMAKESCVESLVNEATVAKDHGDIVNDTVQLSTTGDAAWPNRGSGRSYASFCGMFVLVGALSKRILSAVIFDKMCATCELAEKKEKAPPDHDCWRGARGINAADNLEWRGSSKAMEAAGAVNCVKSMGEFTFCQPCDITAVRVAKFTADEDSNMIAAINDPNGWSGGTLSKNGIDYFNKQYRYVVKTIAALGDSDVPGFVTDDEKATWLSGAVLNIVDHAFNIDPTHAACRRYRAPLPDGAFHPWCGVEAAKPDWQIHLPRGQFLQRDSPPGYYEGVQGVFMKFAHIETIKKQLHNTDTNTNESINGMVVRG
ncbi:hypothetical protein CYMTET_41901 [Cymbomonas tetramitiformis]|uniref:Mutator-like transposase domain-containing protein n=1 Tax=Cymbomonas tetramitiformis TaxID=36881 RepID=A0AAE0C695_9CHLO|nr:hypothetical protein CYMTET_41901 [Cymbomonas tetramitiformis]